MLFQGEVRVKPLLSPQCFVDKTSLSQKPRAYGEGEKRWNEVFVGNLQSLLCNIKQFNPGKSDVHGGR